MSSESDLEDIYDQYEADPAFEHLRHDDINFVPGTGNMNPSAMLIGEAPGTMENAHTTPFIGPAGVELRTLLRRVDIDMSELFLTNVVKYWPRTPDRKTRPPTEQEIRDSKNYLIREIAVVNPTFIGLCGRVPVRTFFPNVPSIRSVNGNLYDEKYIPLYHPAVVLYKREKFDEVLSGYKLLANLIDNI